jgi:hypothetical protein
VDELTVTVDETADVSVLLATTSQLLGMLIVFGVPMTALRPAPVTDTTETVTVEPF